MKDILISGASPVLMPREDPAGKIIFAIVLLVIILICFVALMTFMAAVFREMNERARKAIAWAPVKTVLVGITGLVVFGDLASWLYSLAFIERLLETEIVAGYLVAAILVTALPLLLAILGAPGTFGYIGDRLAALHGGDLSGLRRIVLGTVVSILVALFPVLGWFVVLPGLLVVSLGAGVLAVTRNYLH